MDKDFDIVSYLAKRALESSSHDDTNLLFDETTFEERSIIKDAMSALHQKYQVLYPLDFDFTIDNDDFDSLFIEGLEKVTQPVWCGVYQGRRHVPEYYLTIAKRAAQNIVSRMCDLDYKDYQVQIDAIDHLFPNTKRHKK